MELAPYYPGDIPLCCFGLKGCLYGSIPHTAPEVLAHYTQRQPVKQGYARCSVCIVSDCTIITADTGIAAAAESHGNDVLRIRPGHILLPGYAYGFIGGCAGLIDRGVLAFTGDIQTHPDGEAIRRFCRERDVEIIGLGSGPLLDIGGILPLAEERSGPYAGIQSGY